MAATMTLRHGDIVRAVRLARARFGTPIVFAVGSVIRVGQGLFLRDEGLGQALYQGAWFGGFWLVGYWFVLPHFNAVISGLIPGNMRAEWSISWGDDGIVITRGRNSAAYDHELVTKWYRSDALVVLRRGPMMVVPVPTRDFSPEQRADFEATVRKLLGAPARARGDTSAPGITSAG